MDYVCQGVGDQGECRVIVNGYGVSFWREGNVLKLDIDDGYTINYELLKSIELLTLKG